MTCNERFFGDDVPERVLARLCDIELPVPDDVPFSTLDLMESLVELPAGRARRAGVKVRARILLLHIVGIAHATDHQLVVAERSPPRSAPM